MLGRYRIEKTLGRGGMGEVLLARDRLLDRAVALKRLDPQGADRDAVRRAMLREARRASAISHRHVAAIHDVVRLDGEVVLVMEYVDGQSLRERLDGPLPLETFWSLAAQCAEGVAAAHAAGVIHRDLKPENVMLTRSGEVKLLDFGIARRSGPAGSIHTSGSDSSSGGIAGTPHYMAPEAHVGGVVDERTDLFSLGVMYYEMLAGRRPFEGGTYAVVVNQILNADPVPLAELNPEAGEALSSLVAALLAKHPGDRVASAGALLERLDLARQGGPPGPAPGRRPVPIPAPRTGARRSALRRAVPAAAALALLAAGALAWRMASAPALPRAFLAAVLPPETPGARGDFADFATGAMALVERRLRLHSDRPGFQLAFFGDAFPEGARTAPEAGRLLGADVAISTVLEQAPDRLRARLELRETSAGRLIGTREVDVPAQRPFDFLDRVYREAAGMLRLPPLGDSTGGTGIRGPGTLRFYLAGLGTLVAAPDTARTRRALDAFESACLTEPESATALAALASARLRMHQLTEDAVWLARADSASRLAVEADGASGEAHRVRGAVRNAQRRSAEALAELSTAARLMPHDDDVALRHARAYAHAGDPASERKAYLDTRRRRPHDYRPHWWLATHDYREGRLDDAIRSYREMTLRAPRLHLGHANLGAMLVLRGDYGPAIASLRRSLECRPTAGAFSNLGTACFNSGRIAEAVEAYNQAFQFGAPDYVMWLNLGDASLWLKGRERQAREAYAQAVVAAREELRSRSRRAAATDPVVLANLAVLFSRLGRADSARSYAARALEADSSNWRVEYAVALATWRLGDRARAVERMERAVKDGYPVVWLRDSPMFREWRGSDRFRALVGDTLGNPGAAARSGKGG